MAKKKKSKMKKILGAALLAGLGAAALRGRNKGGGDPNMITGPVEPATEKAEKFQKAAVKLWLEEIKKQNISKEKTCQIEDTTNKSLVSKLVVKF